MTKSNNKIDQLNNCLQIAEKNTCNQFIEINQNIPNNLVINDNLKLSLLPVAIKDNIAVNGMRMTCNSEVLKNYVASYDATVVSRLKQQGSIIIGKTNMDEFAMGEGNNYGFQGMVKNPHNHQQSAGGSSGGSAASVAVGSSIVSLGSDTGGSIMHPSHFCRVLGFKPSYGAISRYGLTLYSSSCDHIGIMSNNLDDLTKVFEVISGDDYHDYTTYGSQNYLNLAIQSQKHYPHKVIGIIDDHRIDNTQLIKVLTDLGIKIKVIKLLDIISVDFIDYTYQLVAYSEAYSNLARFTGLTYGNTEAHKHSQSWHQSYENVRSCFGSMVQTRILAGAYFITNKNSMNDTWFNQGQKMRRYINSVLTNIYQDVEIIISPIVSTNQIGNHERSIFTIANFTGGPSLIIPINPDHPYSFHLMSKRWNDYYLIEIAKKIINSKIRYE